MYRGFESHPLRMEENNNQIEWVAPEFEQHQKSKSWFITIGIISGILFLLAIFTKNILFALLIGLSYFTMSSYAIKKPKDIKISINSKRIRIEKTLYALENIRSFWIFYDPPEIKELSLRSKKMIMPYIKIQIGEQNPVEIRKILIKYIPEKEHKESLIDNISRQIGF